MIPPAVAVTANGFHQPYYPFHHPGISPVCGCSTVKESIAPLSTKTIFPRSPEDPAFKVTVWKRHSLHYPKCSNHPPQCKDRRSTHRQCVTVGNVPVVAVAAKVRSPLNLQRVIGDRGVLPLRSGLHSHPLPKCQAMITVATSFRVTLPVADKSEP